MGKKRWEKEKPIELKKKKKTNLERNQTFAMYLGLNKSTAAENVNTNWVSDNTKKLFFNF